ncbi:MAG TPA: glycosyltransferase family 2 protein [Rudaea sp.]|jgi:cellulose synthase/poly-beta-1,6-N-acetylglucosamine synthase-like glycosyltransferase
MSALVFWFSLALVAYTYAGYAMLVELLARRRGQAPQTGSAAPPLTVVVAAFNEAGRIRARVADILAQDYPASHLNVVVVSDGSNDGTAGAAAVDDSRVQVLALPENRGKAVALNSAMQMVATALVVFTDARQSFAPMALRRLVAAFADPQVGAISGELELREKIDGQTRPAPAGLYWRMEKQLREGEAQLGWLHGVSGAIHALRKDLFQPLPAGTVLDDMWIPLQAIFQGQRVWMARDAIVRDDCSIDSGEEFGRKLRTLAGNWQLIARMPQLLDPWRNPVFTAWISHKLLRLIAPWALIAAWISSALAEGTMYRVAFMLQCAAYTAAAFALAAPRIAVRIPLLAAAGSFVMLNSAALLALPACAAMDTQRLWKKH